MWGPSTPLQIFLQDNSMTTLFFGGVNIDQCVFGTFLDAYYKAYDVILLDDISATTSPLSATQMVNYNSALDGWRANSTDILPALLNITKHSKLVVVLLTRLKLITDGMFIQRARVLILSTYLACKSHSIVM